jgi:hypothetical protein
VLPSVSKSKKLLEHFVNYLTPIVINCSTFHCELGQRPGSKHHEQLVIDVLCKFVSPILKNYSVSLTDEFVRKAVEMRRTNKAAFAAQVGASNSKSGNRKLLTVQPFS